MKKVNIYKQLRESTETDLTPALTQGELAAIFESEGNPLSQSVISKLENSKKEPPSTSIEVLKAYAKHFNVTADYLLGIRDTKTVDENIVMICNVTGLSEQAVESLKKIKECADEEITIKADLDMLNFLMSDFIQFDVFISHIRQFIDSSYNIPMHYDSKVDDFVESELPDSLIKGAYFSIGRKIMLNNEPHIQRLDIGIKVIESYALQCIQKSLYTWKEKYKDERK